MNYNTERDIKAMSYLFTIEESIIAKPIVINIDDSNVTPELPPCGPDLPVPMSSGYWKTNLTFIPLMCRSQTWLQEDIERCLLGKHLYFYGDSTVHQIRHHLLDTFPVISSKLHVHDQFVLLRTGSRVQYYENMLFEGDLIDEITNCTSEIPLVILNFCFHFGSWTTRAYLDRLFGAKVAIVRLFSRCSNSIVVIKLAHPRENLNSVQSVHSPNVRFHDMDRMIRRVFGGIGVSFLDIWDLSMSHTSVDKVHMPPSVIRQEFYLMLSYVCPDMVKKSQF
ncbi:NXPE family member 3-like [Glandiceps talaboti]